MKNKIILKSILALIIFCTCGVPQNASAAVEFKITRLYLYFDNNRAETVAEKNSASLKAYADLSIEGAGLLLGFWEVDGRVLANVSRHISGSRSNISLETPAVPGLPTFESGVHRLRFVVTSPALAAILPEAIYYVAEAPVKKSQVKLLSPRDRETVPYQSTTFLWKREKGAATYLVTFYSADGKPAFSAYTRDHDYQLSETTLSSLFKAGQEYTWNVISYGGEQNRLGKSGSSRFTLKATTEAE